MNSALKGLVKEKPRDRKNKWTWIIGFLYFNAMDMLLTTWAVTQLGAVELNPLMRVLLEQGTWAFVTFKIVIGTLLALWLIARHKYTLLRYLTCLFGFVVFWNLVQLAITGLMLL